MTDEERFQQRLKERARSEAEDARRVRSMVWTIAFAAAINGAGKNAKGATEIADSALAAFDTRFTQAANTDDED